MCPLLRVCGFLGRGGSVALNRSASRSVCRFPRRCAGVTPFVFSLRGRCLDCRISPSLEMLLFLFFILISCSSFFLGTVPLLFYTSKTTDSRHTNKKKRTLLSYARAVDSSLVIFIVCLFLFFGTLFFYIYTPLDPLRLSSFFTYIIIHAHTNSSFLYAVELCYGSSPLAHTHTHTRIDALKQTPRKGDKRETWTSLFTEMRRACKARSRLLPHRR